MGIGEMKKMIFGLCLFNNIIYLAISQPTIMNDLLTCEQ